MRFIPKCIGIYRKMPIVPVKISSGSCWNSSFDIQIYIVFFVASNMSRKVNLARNFEILTSLFDSHFTNKISMHILWWFLAITFCLVLECLLERSQSYLNRVSVTQVYNNLMIYGSLLLSTCPQKTNVKKIGLLQIISSNHPIDFVVQFLKYYIVFQFWKIMFQSIYDPWIYSIISLTL